MKIITAANSLKPYPHLVEINKKCAAEFGYEVIVYNLGGLGYGVDFPETDETFVNNGYYYEFKETSQFSQEEKIWRSKLLCKPKIMQHAFENNPGEDLLWLDAEARICDDLGLDWDFDIAVAVRPPRCCDSESPLKDKMEGKHNAGVIFFKHNDKVKDFIDRWVAKTYEVMNDQLALNTLLEEEKAGTNMTIRCLPVIYNSKEGDRPPVKIFHGRMIN